MKYYERLLKAKINEYLDADEEPIKNVAIRSCPDIRVDDYTDLKYNSNHTGHFILLSTEHNLYFIIVPQDDYPICRGRDRSYLQNLCNKFDFRSFIKGIVLKVK